MSVESNIKVLKDARFNEKDTHRYNVAISISTKQCSAIVFDPIEDRFIALIETTIDEYLSFIEHKKTIASFLAHSLFSLDYKSVSILYVTFKSTLVPESVFEKDNAHTFLRQ